MNLRFSHFFFDLVGTRLVRGLLGFFGSVAKGRVILGSERPRSKFIDIRSSIN
jgi:hypothetical protein